MSADFDNAWHVADTVPGWLTREQGRSLWDAASTLGTDALVVEIGSHQGRSTLVLARSAAGTGARVVAVDPFVEGRLFGGASTRDKFEQNVRSAGLDDQVELIARPSTELRPGWGRPLSMVFIDGKHDYWTTRDDLRWAEHLPEGAPLLMHDTFSSIGVTLAVLAHVLPGRRLRYLDRTGSLARFEVGAVGWRDRARILAELPWFVRNVAIKIALRVLRAFGVFRPDPY